MIICHIFCIVLYVYYDDYMYIMMIICIFCIVLYAYSDDYMSYILYCVICMPSTESFTLNEKLIIFNTKCIMFNETFIILYQISIISNANLRRTALLMLWIYLVGCIKSPVGGRCGERFTIDFTRLLIDFTRLLIDFTRLLIDFTRLLIDFDRLSAVFQVSFD